MPRRAPKTSKQRILERRVKKLRLAEKRLAQTKPLDAKGRARQKKILKAIRTRRRVCEYELKLRRIYAKTDDPEIKAEALRRYRKLKKKFPKMYAKGNVADPCMPCVAKAIKSVYPRTEIKNGKRITRYSSSITIEGTKEFQARTVKTLDKLNKTGTGKSLIKSLDSHKRPVQIKEYTKQGGQCRPYNYQANVGPDGKPGLGSGSVVLFNPDFEPTVHGAPSPNTVVLGHELIHAEHNARGVRDLRKNKKTGTKNEELKTVGLPPYPEKGLTENSLRDDLNLKRRPKY